MFIPGRMVSTAVMTILRVKRFSASTTDILPEATSNVLRIVLIVKIRTKALRLFTTPVPVNFR